MAMPDTPLPLLDLSDAAVKKLIARGKELGAYLLQALKPLERHPIVGQVRGLGMMAAVELVDRDKSGAGFYDGGVPLAARVIERCVQNGQLPRRLNNVTRELVTVG